MKFFKELLLLKFVNKKNINIISKKTRDKKVSVYRDKKTGVIFLKKVLNNRDYYQNNKWVKSKFSLKDDERRAIQFKNLTKNKNLLDFGCGDGKFLNIVKNAKSYSGLELNLLKIKNIKKSYKKINIVEKIDELKVNFDLVTCFHVLEHLPEQVQSLKNLRKKMKKNAKIIIEVPHANDFLLNLPRPLGSKFLKFTLWSEHLILHTKNSLEKVLKVAGFSKIKIQFYQRYNLNNHLYWLLFDRPSGHDLFKSIKDNKIINAHKKTLEKNQLSDTLIAIASNS